MLTAAQLAAVRREQGMTRQGLASQLGRTSRWLMFIEEGRIPLTETAHDDLLRALNAHKMVDTKDPGAVGAAIPGSNLTSNQKSN